MSSRNRRNPLLSKPYEYPEALNYSAEVGAYYPHRTAVKYAPKAKRGAEVVQRDYRLKRFYATKEPSFLYGMQHKVTLIRAFIGPRENAARRALRLAARTE